MVYYATMEAGRSLIATFVLLLATTVASMAQDTSEGGWIADPRTGCKLWMPAPKPEHTIHWNGPCKNGLVEGTSIVFFSFKGKGVAKYVGSVVAGRFEGRGIYYVDDSFHYDGDWRAGAKTGQGVQEWKDGRRYEGGWKENKASGSGVFIDARGNTWAGTWLGGCLRRPDQSGVRFRVGVGIESSACPSR
jgi:hypothetical protein